MFLEGHVVLICLIHSLMKMIQFRLSTPFFMDNNLMGAFGADSQKFRGLSFSFLLENFYDTISVQIILEYNVYHVLVINLLTEPVHAPSMTAIKNLVGSWRVTRIWGKTAALLHVL